MEGIEKSCPFCGSTKMNFGTSSEICIVGPPHHFDTETRWYVSCDQCGTHGPIADSLETAKVLWNNQKLESLEFESKNCPALKNVSVEQVQEMLKEVRNSSQT